MGTDSPPLGHRTITLLVALVGGSLFGFAIGRLASAGSQAVPIPAPSGNARPPPPPDLQPGVDEESRFAKRLEEHRLESIDPIWARETKASLEGDVSTQYITQLKNMRLLEVDCRSRSCLMKLEWPSYKTAMGSIKGVLREPFSTNCGRYAFLPPPPDPNAAFQTTIIFYCRQ